MGMVWWKNKLAITIALQLHPSIQHFRPNTSLLHRFAQTCLALGALSMLRTHSSLIFPAVETTISRGSQWPSSSRLHVCRFQRLHITHDDQAIVRCRGSLLLVALHFVLAQKLRLKLDIPRLVGSYAFRIAAQL